MKLFYGITTAGTTDTENLAQYAQSVASSQLNFWDIYLVS